MKYLALIIVVLLSFNVQAAQDRGLFWRVQSKTATVYLLGSIHFADASFYPMRKKIQQAFDHSDNLVVEVKMDAAGVAQARKMIQKEGVYPGNDTIRDHLKADTYDSLRKQLQQLDIPYSTVEHQKPGILIMTLTAAQMMQLGFKSDDGIDIHFIHRAEAQKKPILELETIQQQLNLLLKIADGDLLIQEALSDFDQTDDTMRSLVQSWKRGDEKRLNTILFDDVLAQHPSYLPLYKQLFFRRNTAMAKKIEGYLKTDKRYFVVVGAGHLIGDKSVVALLNRNGYKAERF
jgi:uncharacterized protein YbaP (TraB family)